ncbi:hypothetical protein Cni_G05477 [Canna indica]|uniref:DUF7653 domain-containing protein n=1 Tax=Canna indica TaxID=4628 RepID=A0AAQ3JZC8_9LILI|nr:hypothetical protein Cni_G05477 [Canna indica]
MRKFFSFKSSGSISTNCHSDSSPPAPSSSNDLINWKKLQNSHSKFSVHEKVHDLTQTLKDTTLKPQNQCPGSEDSSHLLHRRSHSSSSYAVNNCFIEGNAISFSDMSRPTSSCGNSPHHASNCQRDCHALTPQRCTRSRNCNLFPSHSNDVEQYGYPCSLRNPEIISGSSPCNSPVPLRCSAARLSWYPERNELLDRFIDGEDQEAETHSKSCLYEPGTEYFLSKQTYPIAGPQQVQSTAVPSLTYTNENTSTNLPREENDTLHCASVQNWTKDYYGTVSSCIKKPSHEFLGKLTMNFRDCDSENNNTFEDINTDSFESQPTSHSDDIAKHCSTDDSPSYKKQNTYFTGDIVGLEKYDGFLDNGSLNNRNGKVADYDLQDTDEELLKQLIEVENMIDLLSKEDFDLTIPQSRNIDISQLFQTIRNTEEDRKHLLLWLSLQLKRRLTDRHVAKEHIRQTRTEMSIQTRRLERVKSEFQFSLEKELDRRSNYLSMKIERSLLDEQRLLERVRDLAEQNISLQWEISSLKGIEGNNQIRIVNSEVELANLTATLEQIRTENCKLQKNLSDIQERFNVTEKDRDCIRRCFCEKEKENKELQKLVVHLQRMCNEQEMTINGLRIGFSEEIGKKLTRKCDQLGTLQMEQLRLSGIEQNIRKELESCKHELETLRHENIGLLNRLQAAGNGHGFSSIKLDQELHARVDSLHTGGLSLLNDVFDFNDDILGVLKNKQSEHGPEAKKDTTGYSFLDYTIKNQSLKRRYENYRGSLKTTAEILDDKSHSQADGHQPAEGSVLNQSEDELEIQLKAETILTKLLREKLFSNELEFERLQADLASSIRIHDVLHTEIQRMRDEVSCLTHRTTQMELQILRKDESIKQLDSKYQECAKELTATRNILLKVAEERNHMWEEVKNSREKNMLLDCEVLSLKKKIEELDEDILTKEGQIAILRDSLEKPYDLIFSPRSLKELSLE